MVKVVDSQNNNVLPCSLMGYMEQNLLLALIWLSVQSINLKFIYIFFYDITCYIYFKSPIHIINEDKRFNETEYGKPTFIHNYLISWFTGHETSSQTVTSFAEFM